MKNTHWLVLAAEVFLATQAAFATTSITFEGVTESSDYSDAGSDLGNLGYLFFNFDAPSPTSSSITNVDQNVVNALPSWIGVEFDFNSPNYSFGQDMDEETFSKGGQPSWATLTLPDGTSGLSGALVDPRATDNSNNTIKNLPVLSGAPAGFLLHIVTDNTNLEHDSANRIRAREDISDLDFRVNNPSFDGSPDVYTFLYRGVSPGDVLKVQLNSGVAGEAPSIAGIMFDVVPEPAIAALLAAGVFGLGLIRRRS